MQGMSERPFKDPAKKKKNMTHFQPQALKPSLLREEGGSDEGAEFGAALASRRGTEQINVVWFLSSRGSTWYRGPLQ